jgi:hypothetical protein
MPQQLGTDRRRGEMQEFLVQKRPEIEEPS